MKKFSLAKITVIFWCLIVVGLIVGGIGALTENSAIIIAGVAVLIAAVVFHFVFYRCPHCGGYLNQRSGDFCPHCGKKSR